MFFFCFCFFSRYFYPTALQAATILVAMASGKNIWRQTSGENRQLATNRLKEKLAWKIINNRAKLINSTSGGITCVTHFPSRHSESRMHKLKWAAAQNGEFDWFEEVLHTIGIVAWSQQLCNVEINRFCNEAVYTFSFSYCSKMKCWKRAVRRISHSCNVWLHVSVLPFNFFFADWIFVSTAHAQVDTTTEKKVICYVEESRSG